ncbi:hypothetical protein WMY93_030138 [Mugilogobius chulae]|uniref:Uncharacterized protein n=1 Tax=Mugilogobius chulae TaxID=88201 RepID=A0AAW0MV53_9GOBI
MTLKLLQRLPRQLGQIVIHRYAFTCPNSRLLVRRQPKQHLCAASLCTACTSYIQLCKSRKLQMDETRRGLTTTIIREPSFMGSSSVGLHKDSFPRFCLTQMHQPTQTEQQSFYMRLNKCTSSRQVFRLLHSVEVMTDSMAAASLHRVADLEQGVNCLNDPLVWRTIPSERYANSWRKNLVV